MLNIGLYDRKRWDHNLGRDNMNQNVDVNFNLKYEYDLFKQKWIESVMITQHLYHLCYLNQYWRLHIPIKAKISALCELSLLTFPTWLSRLFKSEKLARPSDFNILYNRVCQFSFYRPQTICYQLHHIYIYMVFAIRCFFLIFLNALLFGVI